MGFSKGRQIWNNLMSEPQRECSVLSDFIKDRASFIQWLRKGEFRITACFQCEKSSKLSKVEWQRGVSKQDNKQANLGWRIDDGRCDGGKWIKDWFPEHRQSRTSPKHVDETSGVLGNIHHNMGRCHSRYELVCFWTSGLHEPFYLVWLHDWRRWIMCGNIWTLKTSVSVRGCSLACRHSVKYPLRWGFILKMVSTKVEGVTAGHQGTVCKPSFSLAGIWGSEVMYKSQLIKRRKYSADVKVLYRDNVMILPDCKGPTGHRGREQKLCHLKSNVMFKLGPNLETTFNYESVGIR